MSDPEDIPAVDPATGQPITTTPSMFAGSVFNGVEMSGDPVAFTPEQAAELEAAASPEVSAAVEAAAVEAAVVEAPVVEAPVVEAGMPTIPASTPEPTAPAEVPVATQPDVPEQKPVSAGSDALFGDPSIIDPLQRDIADRTNTLGEEQAQAYFGIAEAQAEHARQLAANADELAATEERVRQDTIARQESLLQASRELYSQPFDPRRIFHSPDNAASIGVHLSYAIGAMIQASQATNFPGSNPANVAARIIDSAAEADVALQRESFRRGESSLQAESAFSESMRLLGLDEVNALEHVRSRANEHIASQIEAIAQDFQGTRAGEEAGILVQRYRLRAAEGQRAVDMAMLELDAQRQRAQLRRGRRRAPTNSRAFMSLMSSPPGPEASQEQRERYEAFSNLPSGEQVKFANQLNNLGFAVSSIDRLIRPLRSGDVGGGVNMNGEELAAFRSSAASLVAYLKDTFKLGALDAGVAELTNAMSGGTGEIGRFQVGFASNTRAALTRMRETLTAQSQVINTTIGTSANMGAIGSLVDQRPLPEQMSDAQLTDPSNPADTHDFLPSPEVSLPGRDRDRPAVFEGDF